MATKPEILNAYLERIVAGDLEGAADYYTDDVVFHWAGQGPVSGDHTGRAAVLGVFADYASRAQSSIETHDTLYSDDHAVALVRATLTRGDRSLVTNRVVVYHFAGDRISEVWVVDADQQAVDGLLAQPAAASGRRAYLRVNRDIAQGRTGLYCQPSVTRSPTQVRVNEQRYGEMVTAVLIDTRGRIVRSGRH